MNYLKLTLTEFIELISDIQLLETGKVNCQNHNLTEIEAYEYFKNKTNNFEQKFVKMALHEMYVFRDIDLDDIQTKICLKLYSENGWEIPKYIKTGKLGEIEFTNYKEMKAKVMPFSSWLLYYSIKLLEEKEALQPQQTDMETEQEQPTIAKNTDNTRKEITELFDIEKAKYLPTLEKIKAHLETLNTASEKIKYLEIEKIKYLQNVSSVTLAASGAIYPTLPKELFLDREISLLIKLIKLTEQQIEPPKDKAKQYTAKHYLLAYLFECNAKGEIYPMGNKKELERIGNERMGVGKGNRFYKVFNEIINKDLNSEINLIEIGGENWRKAVLELSKAPKLVEAYLHKKQL